MHMRLILIILCCSVQVASIKFRFTYCLYPPPGGPTSSWKRSRRVSKRGLASPVVAIMVGKGRVTFSSDSTYILWVGHWLVMTTRTPSSVRELLQRPSFNSPCMPRQDRGNCICVPSLSSGEILKL
ncbi:hypothetical protein AVEN_174417-1 [Araneus ventricosus]|uniref:Secreted protein n=1 Tax=Araneus ventricosus TaxID=182803 RepID=A0A4Y2S8L4_ARAVE|nr:hypothetical protein AVEN_174417-1 [Araneus ventricosus]